MAKQSLLRRFLAPWNRATKEPRHPDESRVWIPPRTLAGVSVNEDNMLTNAAAFAAVRYLSQSVASLPWRAMRMVAGSGGEVAAGHHVDNLLHVRASPEWSPYAWRETMISWAIRYGNAVSEIEPDQIGRPIALWPIHPDRVDFCRSEVDGFDSYGDEIPAGAMFYEIDNGTKGRAVLSARRVFHLRGYGGDSPVGLNLTAYAAQTLGWAKAVQMFGSAYFGNGMHIGGVVKNRQALSPEALALQKAEFRDAHRGARNAFSTVHLDVDSDYVPFASNLADAQFIELHHHLIEEVCRFVGVPPHKVQHLLRSTFSNIEHQSIEVVTDSLIPWIRKLEEEADYKLFNRADRGMWSKVAVAALLRGDMKSQAESLAIARQHGVISADEWRALLDMRPLPDGAGGEKYLVQAAQIDLADVGKNFVPANDNGARQRAA